jgi:membrane-bound metal-dependent hydrolase YbcI (DUF457 family)
MCTPVGHSLIGYSIFLTLKKPGIKRSWYLPMAAVFLTSLPDIDLIFGYCTGDPNRYHHCWTHSIGFAILVGLILAAGSRFAIKGYSLYFGFAGFILILSHILLDFFTKDTSIPFGMQVLWPINQSFYLSSCTIFREVTKASSSPMFLRSLFCWHNLMTVLMEMILLGPVLVISWTGFRMKRRTTGGK